MILSPEDARKQSVQILPAAQRDGSIAHSSGWFVSPLLDRGSLLPRWGTRERERFLRILYRNEFNWMVQGAFTGLLKRIASTPWELKGPQNVGAATKAYYEKAYYALNRRLPSGGRAASVRYAPEEREKSGKEPAPPRSDIEYWQSVLRDAHFGRGWGDFIKMGVDFLRQDGGWYWEVIAPGDPNGEPTGPVMGIAHLDSLRIIPTGDPEFPAVYWDSQNKAHRLHRTRVVQLQDMPEQDEMLPGYGLCALSRAAAIVDRELWMGRYISSMLDDKPSPGIVIATGLNKQARDAAYAMYRNEQARDELPPWGKQLWFFGLDIEAKADIVTKTFQSPPEKFDFNQYTQIDVDALALALGVDKQDLWQLSGRMAGTAAQSEVLSQKSRGKALGDLMASIERAINDLLPDEYIFQFKNRDTQEELERAQIGLTIAQMVGAIGPRLSDAEARAILSDKIDSVHDALIDENGQIANLGDRDVGGLVDNAQAPLSEKPTPSIPGQTTTGGQTTVGDTAIGAGGGQNQAAVGHTASGVGHKMSPVGQPDGGTMGLARSLDPPVAEVGAIVVSKAIQATLLDFEGDWADMVQAALDGAMDRMRFGVVGRALLRKYETAAFQDGLKDGGIADGELSEEDRARLFLRLATDNGYFSAFAARVFARKGTAMTADARAAAWDASIVGAYQDGLVSADKNGLYLWLRDDPLESCPDCLKLDQQIHRLGTWTRKGLLPKSERLKCRGGCACKLVRVTGKATGRFLN